VTLAIVRALRNLRRNAAGRAHSRGGGTISPPGILAARDGAAVLASVVGTVVGAAALWKERRGARSLARSFGRVVTDSPSAHGFSIAPRGNLQRGSGREAKG
jgi:hypothetical protein